jgi:hypothetical protein
MVKENLFGEWLLVVFVPSITLLLGRTLVDLMKEINLFLALFLVGVIALLYLAELYSLVRRTLEKFGVNI